jgi:hypothetical protein
MWIDPDLLSNHPPGDGHVVVACATSIMGGWTSQRRDVGVPTFATYAPMADARRSD